jgi:acetyl-CoA carboxylase alpha subunit
MTLSLEQKIAQKEAEIARLKEQARKKENGQKIIIGGLMLSVAKDDSRVAKQLLELIETQITRKTDLNRLDNVIDELKKKANELNHQPNFNQQ